MSITSIWLRVENNLNFNGFSFSLSFLCEKDTKVSDSIKNLTTLGESWQTMIFDVFHQQEVVREVVYHCYFCLIVHTFAVYIYVLSSFVSGNWNHTVPHYIAINCATHIFILYTKENNHYRYEYIYFSNVLLITDIKWSFVHKEINKFFLQCIAINKILMSEWTQASG